MNILVTGGFGSIGVVVIDECLRRGHNVSVLEVRGRRTEKMARRYGRRRVGVFFGDIRKAEDVACAVSGQDAVLHLAAILPPQSDSRPDLCFAVNVGGTENIIRSLRAASNKPALVSVSSASVMGFTQGRTPPVRPDDPVSPSDTYSKSKIEAEALVSASGLTHCILRLAAVLPTVLNLSSLIAMSKLLFVMPLGARCEIVFDVDVARALVSAAEDLARSGGMSGRRGFIAGGQARGCRMTTRELVASLFRTVGLRAPRESLFPPRLDSYYLDWYDTELTQEILRYQEFSFEQWQSFIRGRIRFIRPLIKLLEPVILSWLEKQSPLHPASKQPAAPRSPTDNQE